MIVPAIITGRKKPLQAYFLTYFFNAIPPVNDVYRLPAGPLFINEYAYSDVPVPSKITTVTFFFQ